jgi:hypothetical protein
VRRFIYATPWGMLYRFTLKQWQAYLSAGEQDPDVRIGRYADLIGSVKNVTDWEPEHFTEEREKCQKPPRLKQSSAT